MSTSKCNRALASVLIIASSLIQGCGSDPADPKSPEQVLLDKAIHALWGDVAPESVLSLETQSTLTATQTDFTATFELETLLASDECYREVRLWKDFGIQEEFVQGPKKSWRLVDGTVVEISDRENKDQAPESRQNWLFQISKLTVLKNTERYKLKHRGRHKNDKGLAIERLDIYDQVRTGTHLTLDFSVSNWLVERVTLEVDASDESFTLVLKDYRPINGIQFPHQIDSLNNGKPHAHQRDISYTINPPWKKEAFEAPIDLNRDAVVSKQSIGGLFATAPLVGPTPDVKDTIGELRNWIVENELEINGPLVILRQPNRPGPTTGPKAEQDRVAIAIRRLTPQMKKKTAASREFAILDLKSQPALCLTQVGTKPFNEIKNQIKKLKSGARFTMDAMSLEIYFSPEGTIRQVQIPVQQ